VAIAHGTLDSVISVDWGRRARDRMVAAGADVTYHESPVPHAVDPAVFPILAAWLGEVI
jgi:phospholipase/carboxylesterase